MEETGRGRPVSNVLVPASAKRRGGAPGLAQLSSAWQQPPAGMPQAPPPQPEIGGALERLAAPTEKTEIRCSSLRLWQLGHSGFCDPMTRASKGFWHSLQTYSKIGIV